MKNRPILSLCLVLCLIACHDKAALKQALIEKTVQEKVESHIRKKKAACLKESMQDALVLADSLMIKLALSNVDTSNRVNKPIKPARPQIELPTDTTPIKPLFEDSVKRIIDSSILLNEAPIQKGDTSSNIKKLGIKELKRKIVPKENK